MIAALTNSKVPRAVRDSEDVLTSTVFGILELMPCTAVMELLALAEPAEGASPSVSSPDVVETRFLYWPWLGPRDGSGCEPDLVIETLRADRSVAARILVEAKYRSGKSSEADTTTGGEERPVRDQLAREWLGLSSLEPDAPGMVIYLTADHIPPWSEIADAQAELALRRRPQGSFAWLSWRHLHVLARTRRSEHRGWNMLEGFLSDLELTGFTGITPPRLHRGWGYLQRFEWNPGVLDSGFRFSRSEP